MLFNFLHHSSLNTAYLPTRQIPEAHTPLLSTWHMKHSHWQEQPTSTAQLCHAPGRPPGNVPRALWGWFGDPGLRTWHTPWRQPSASLLCQQSPVLQQQSKKIFQNSGREVEEEVKLTPSPYITS